MNNDKKVFIDADAFIALIRPNDTNKDKAEKIAKKLASENYFFATSNYVFSEVVTVLSIRESREVSLKFIQQVKDKPGLYDFYWIDSLIEEKAIEIYKKQTSKNVSFTDCTNMALLEIHHISLIFSFDQIYRKNGFKIVK